MNYTQIIHFCFAFLVIIIAVSSFSLSFINLEETAIQAGIPAYVAWAWPITIDSFILLGSLFVLVANLNKEPAWQGWAVLLTFTVLSCGFNIAHSPSDIISRVAHGALPVALCSSLELLMIRIKRDLMRTTDSPNTPAVPIPPASPEKIEKVRSWFTDNPDGTNSQARQALRMGYQTVTDCREYLIRTGQLSDPPV